MRTVYGFGYAFAGEAEAERTARGPPRRGVAPRVLWEKRVIPLVEGENVLGRDEDVTVRIDAPGVSRRHARIRVVGRRGHDRGPRQQERDLRGGRCVAGHRADRAARRLPVPPRPRAARLPQLARGGLDDDRAPGIVDRGMSERWTEDDREAALAGPGRGHASPRAVLGRAGCRAGPRGPVDAAREAPARVHHRSRQLLRHRPSGRPAVRPGGERRNPWWGDRPSASPATRRGRRTSACGTSTSTPLSPRATSTARSRSRDFASWKRPGRSGSPPPSTLLLLHAVYLTQVPASSWSAACPRWSRGCGRRASTPSCSSPSDPSAAGPWDWSSGRWRGRGSRR